MSLRSSIKAAVDKVPTGNCRPHMKYDIMGQFVLTGRGFSFFEGILTEALEIFHSGKDRVNRLFSEVATMAWEALNKSLCP